MFKNLTIMKRKKFNTWNNAPCRTIFYHVTEGSHRAALYCFYNHRELFSDDLTKRIVEFIFNYLRYDYLKFDVLDELSITLTKGFKYKVLKFYAALIHSHDVDMSVNTFIHQLINKIYEE